ncbi:hypothetical protein FRC0088_02160 [Corynebacterium diphtheriae]|nr:hypothetical protein FRC0088_02160 [Corynebacterium diphtheriae]
MTDQSAIKPSVGTIVTSTALATLLAGGAAAGAVAMTIPSPQRENYVVSNQEQYRPSHTLLWRSMIAMVCSTPRISGGC